MIPTPVVTALNASTYTAITLGELHAYGFSIYVDDATAFIIAIDASGTGAATVPASTSVSWGHYEAEKAIVLYAKASAGTPNLVLTPGKNH